MNTHQRTLALAHELARDDGWGLRFITQMRVAGFVGVPKHEVATYLVRYDSLTSG